MYVTILLPCLFMVSVGRFKNLASKLVDITPIARSL
jgi:hypothetical protein